MATRTLDIGCHFRYSSLSPTSAVLIVQPEASELVELSDEQWSVSDGIELRDYRDFQGNLCHRFVIPTGISTLTYSAVATVPDAEDEADYDAPEVDPIDLPDDVLIYTVPSRFVLPDVLGGRAWREFAGMKPGYRRVEAIMNWTWNNLTYTAGSSQPTTTAADAFTVGRGVCRDFAHLMITMCRAMNIPARYAYGYLPDMDVVPNPAPMDFHAWVEVYLGDRWWVFDPRHNARRKGRVQIAHGRDAADIAMITTYGAPWMQLMTVTANERVPAPTA